MKIAVCTMYSPSYKEVSDVTVPVMRHYCDKHGYEFHEIKIEDDNYHYKKHEYFKDLLGTDVDVVFYLDCDAIFTNMNTKIESFLDSRHDFYITRDKTELNGGVFFLKNTDWVNQWNDFILFQRVNFPNEQNCYNHFRNDPHWYKKIKELPHPSINSYLYENYVEYGKLTPEEGQWEEGQFILHVPALHPSKKAEILNNVKITE